MSAGLDQARQSASGRSNADKPLPRTLRELRYEHGLKLTEAAVRANLVPGRLSELERGLRWPSRDELTALGYVYRVELECGFVVRERV